MINNYYEKEKIYPPEDYVRVDHVVLRNFVTQVFTRLGVKREYAEIVADNLVLADLMGISSHGVQRIMRYVNGVRSGVIKPNNEPILVSEVGAITILNGRQGFGQVVGVKAIEYAVEKAGLYGIGVVGVYNSNHYGIAGYYALKIVEKKYIGFSTTNSRALVSYTNTIGRNIGTNPIAIGIPRKNPPPILFDAATSVVPIGKIEIYSRINKEIPPGWVIDTRGEILSGDPVRIMDLIRKGEASLLPLGGLGEEHGGHKGSGLSFLIDILAGILVGGTWSLHVGYTVGEKPSNVSHLFIALDIECFMDREVFYEKLEKYIEEIKNSKKHPSAEKIWIPGEKSWYTMETRKKIGIPLHKKIYRELNTLAEELGIEKLKVKHQT